MKLTNLKFVVSCIVFLCLVYVITERDNSNVKQETLPEGAIVKINLPSQLSELSQSGKTLFEAICATCHGRNAVGKRNVAPPLVHKIYEPSHHGDESFQLAVLMGVKAHHWKFGNLPAIEGLNRKQVEKINLYRRELQKANNIF